jgi:hypothetical protein
MNEPFEPKRIYSNSVRSAGSNQMDMQRKRGCSKQKVQEPCAFKPNRQSSGLTVVWKGKGMTMSKRPIRECCPKTPGETSIVCQLIPGLSHRGHQRCRPRTGERLPKTRKTKRRHPRICLKLDRLGPGMPGSRQRAHLSVSRNPRSAAGAPPEHNQNVRNRNTASPECSWQPRIVRSELGNRPQEADLDGRH